MTKFQIFKKVLLEVWYFVLAYISDYLFPKIKEAFIKSREHFIETLWEEIKEDIGTYLHNTIENVKVYYGSESYETKEKIIIDFVFSKIQLNSVVKFFAKKLLKKKLRASIEKSFEKFDTII